MFAGHGTDRRVLPCPKTSITQNGPWQKGRGAGRSGRQRAAVLPLYPYKKYYTQTGDTDDLISIGTIGLIKGINTYQPGRKIKLATYAARCIENEILMYLRKTRRTAGEVSLSDALENDDSANALSLMDVIRVEDNILDDLESRDTCLRVRRCVETALDCRERDIVMQRYGLNGQTPRTQREIAAALGISRSYVSRLEKRALQKLQRALEQPGDMP